MRKLCTGFFIFFFSISLYAQTDSITTEVVPEPVDTVKTVKAKPVPKPKNVPKKDSVKVTTGPLLSIIESGKGCIRDENGKWCSSYNRIPFSNPDYNNEFYLKYRIGTENFKQIRIMEVKVDQKPYYALIWQKTAGYYTDPDSIFDYSYFSAADFYIFEKEDIKNLMPDSMKFNEPYEASLRVKYAGNISYSSVSQFESRINRFVNDYLSTAHLYDTVVKTYYQFTLYPVKNKNGSFMRFNTWLGYAPTGTLPAPVPLSTFEEQYFEVPFETFRRFAKPGN